MKIKKSQNFSDYKLIDLEMTFKVIGKMSNNYFYELSKVHKFMQYDKLTFDARFLGIWYICLCTKTAKSLNRDNIQFCLLVSHEGMF